MSNDLFSLCRRVLVATRIRCLAVVALAIAGLVVPSSVASPAAADDSKPFPGASSLLDRVAKGAKNPAKVELFSSKKVKPVQSPAAPSVAGEAEPPKKVRELVDERTATSSTWRNDDGSLTVEKYAAPRHFRARKGQWKKIRTKLSPVPGLAHTWESKDNSWSVRFAPVDFPEGAIKIRQPEGSVTFTPRDVLDRNAGPRVSGSVATYEGLWKNADLVEEVRSDSTKETIALTGPSAAAAYEFDLEGASARPERDGSLSVWSNGRRIASMPPASVTAADQDQVAGRLAGADPKLEVIDGGVSVSVSERWLSALPDSAFPVEIDPTYNPGGYNTPTTAVSYSDRGSWTLGSAILGANAQGDWTTALEVPFPEPPAPVNGQVWQLGYAGMVAFCQTACSLSNDRAWSLPQPPSNYATANAGDDMPSYFDDSFDEFYAFLGNSSWTGGDRPWVGISADVSAGTVSIPASAIVYSFRYYQLPEPTEVVAPADGAVIATTTPVLKAQTPDDVCPTVSSTGSCDSASQIHHNFKVRTAPEGEPGQVVAESGWIQTPYETDDDGNIVLEQPSWEVPTGALIDGVTYYASVEITNNLILYPSDEHSGNIYLEPNVGEESEFSVHLRLGAGGPSAKDTVGTVPGESESPSEGTPSSGTIPTSVTVNLATGNLAASVSTPAMQTLSGSAGIALNYNSLQASTSGAAATATATYGLRGEYFKDPDDAHAIPASAPVGTRVDPAIDLHGARGAAPIGGIDPNNATAGAGYVVRWTGRIDLPPASAVPPGTTFRLGGASTGGMRVILDSTTIFDSWDGPAGSADARTFGETSLPPGASGALRVEAWEPNSAATTTTQLWVDQDSPADGTHAEYVVPSTWLQTSSAGLPPGWTYSTATAGWSHLDDLGAQVVVHGATGDTLTFTRREDGTYAPPRGKDNALTITDGGTLQMSTASGLVYSFNTDGTLAAMSPTGDEDNPAALQYRYAPAASEPGSPVLLAKIIDPVSTREISLLYGGQAGCPALNGAPANMLCQVDFWDGSTAGFHYNANGQLGGVLSPGSAWTLFGYNSSNQLEAVRDTTATDYVVGALPGSDACATSQSSTACQFDTVVQYDASGRVTGVAQPAPQSGSPRPTRAYTYERSSGDSAAGTTYVRVAGFAPAATTDLPSGVAFSQSYDEQARVTSRSDSTGLTSHVIWDHQSRPIIQVSADGLQTSTVYDSSSNPTDVYGPAPLACFTAGPSNPWPTGTGHTSPPAPIEGYLPVANPTAAPACATDVPHAKSRFDEGFDGLGIVYWPNRDFAGAPAVRDTGNGTGVTAAPCTGTTGGTSADSLCATWEINSAPGPTDSNGGWSMRLSGQINMPAAATYEFRGASAQPFSLWLDGELTGTNVVKNEAGESAGVDPDFAATVELTEGSHAIRLELEGNDTERTSYALSERTVGESDTFSPVQLSRVRPDYGLETTSIDPDGHVTSTEYAAANGIEPHFRLPTGQTQGTGTATSLTTRTTYEAPGDGSFLRKTATTLPAGGTTTYEYWSGTQGLTSAICGVPAGTSQGGMLKATTGPLPATGAAARRKYLVYDAAGRVAGQWIGSSSTDLASVPSSSWRCTTRDARGRVTKETWPATDSASARTVAYGYAISGNPLVNGVADTASAGLAVYAQTDMAGRLVAYLDANSLRTDFGYNQAGQNVIIIGPQGTVTQAFDPQTGNLSVVALAGETRATVTYDDETNRIIGVVYGNGTGAKLGHDRNGRKNELMFTRTDGAFVTGNELTQSPGGQVLSELQNIGGVLANPNPAGTGARTYQYDAVGRLTQAFLAGSRADYGYAESAAALNCPEPDAGDNTNRTMATIIPDGGSEKVTSYCYNSADQLTSVTREDAPTQSTTYDERGNQLTEGSTTYSYDAADRLVSSTVDGVTTTYMYDPLGRVLSRKTADRTIYYAYGGFSDAPVAVRTDAGSMRPIVALPGGVIMSGGLWAYPDLRGNYTVTTDGAGAVVGDVVNYDPWGLPTTKPSDGANQDITDSFTSFGQAGKITEIDSGITIMGARAYRADQGRFLTVDPVEGGCANAYVYAFGDPLTQEDLTGRFGCGRKVGGLLLGAASFAAGATAIILSGGGATPLVVGAWGLVGAATGFGAVKLSYPICKAGDRTACVSIIAGGTGATLGLIGVPLTGTMAGDLLGAKSFSAGSAGFTVDAVTANQASQYSPSLGSCLKSGLGKLRFW